MTKIGIPTGMLLSTLTAIGCSANVSRRNLSVAQSELTTTTKFFVPEPNPAAVKQVAALVKAHDLTNALRCLYGCHAAGGVVRERSARDVERAVKKTIDSSALQKRVPVLVAYNVPSEIAHSIPRRRLDTAAYKAWIDGFARAIGKGPPS